ncbi:MAG: FecR domain-containing protein [Caulobacteraceae bacterium]|nr:FecR domain-containing protein [Caulobacteraceae bacterium]
MSRPSAPNDDGAVAEAAARWALLHDEGPLTPAQLRDFDRWEAQSEAHGAAFAETLGVLEQVRAAAGAGEILAMRADALAARPDGGTYRRLLTGGAVAACLALGLALAWPWVGQVLREKLPTLSGSPARDYRTDVGERATVSLPDGSLATLDTASEIEVAYSAGERGVRLVKGQALFEVAKHKAAPFRVYAAGRRITAVGTQFDVRLEDRGLRLTLVEGRVRVDGPTPLFSGAIAPAMQVGAGEMLEARNDTTTIRPTDPARQTSWRNGLLLFQDEPLEQAVDEVNRYTTTPIRIEGPIGRDYRVSGVFEAGDPLRFARNLAEVFPLQVAVRPDGAPVVTLRP